MGPLGLIYPAIQYALPYIAGTTAATLGTAAWLKNKENQNAFTDEDIMRYAIQQNFMQPAAKYLGQDEIEAAIAETLAQTPVDYYRRTLHPTIRSLSTEKPYAELGFHPLNGVKAGVKATFSSPQPDTNSNNKPKPDKKSHWWTSGNKLGYDTPWTLTNTAPRIVLSVAKPAASVIGTAAATDLLLKPFGVPWDKGASYFLFPGLRPLFRSMEHGDNKNDSINPPLLPDTLELNDIEWTPIK